MRLFLLVHFSFVFFSIQKSRGEQENWCPSCPNNWEEKEGHCFLWPSVRKSWREAEKFCNDEGGHLASVTNMEIHNYIWSKEKVDPDDYRTFFWIGGSDRDKEGRWKWTDGSEWKFTKWATGPTRQPDNYGFFGEGCVQIYHEWYAKDGWNDADCGKVLQFVCSQRICQNATVTNNNDNDRSSIKDFPVLAVALSSSGVFLIVIVLITVACAARRCSKREEEEMEVDENTVYGVYELGADYERQYSTNEIVDKTQCEIF